MKKEFPHLETERTILRNLKVSDSQQLFSYYNNQKVFQYLDWTGPKSEEDAREIIKSFQDGFTEGWIIRWAIEDKETQKLIGTCFLSEFQDDVKAELGFELSQEFWNKGIMTEVAKCVIDYGLNTLTLIRIQAVCNPENEASQNLLEKLGFQKEGLLRKFEFHTETKKLNDVFMYSLINESIEAGTPVI